MKIPQSKIKQLLTDAAKKYVSEEAAVYFAEENIEAHLRKIPRNNPIKTTVGDIFATHKNKNTEISYLKDLGATLMIDFHGRGPLLYLKQIHDEIESRTKQYGITFVTFVNSNGLHTLHTWVQGLAKRGIVSIVSANGGPEAVVPFNGTRGVLGTNPIAFGFPGVNNNEIHCIDMATSEAPFFEIMEAHWSGADLRSGVAVDSSGNPTNKTAEALDFNTSEDDPVANLLPIGGGYKGFYLVYLLELLTSGLIGSPSSPEMSNDFVPEEHGAILIAFNPKVLGTDMSLSKSIESIHKTLTNQKPKNGTDISIPGTRNNQRIVENEDVDIEVPDDMLEKLHALISSSQSKLTTNMEKPTSTTFIVAGVVLEKDGNYLLVQEKQERAYGLWNLPAGKVDEGDTIEETAIKEAREETGLEVELGQKIDIYHETVKEPVKHAFRATIMGGELRFPENELLDARWFTINEITSMSEEGKLRGAWVLEAINAAKAH